MKPPLPALPVEPKPNPGQLSFEVLHPVDLFPEVAPSEDSDERYTTPETMDWLTKLTGVTDWDLDVASCEESHWAPDYYTKHDNGLIQPWDGNVFANVPWSQCPIWVEEAWKRMGAVNRPRMVLMLLPGNRTDLPWWHELVEPFRDGRKSRADATRFTTHFLPGRTRYGCPGNPRGIGMGSPNFTSVALWWKRMRWGP